MINWYFVIGFVTSAVVLFIWHTVNFVRHHYGRNLSLLEIIKLIYMGTWELAAKKGKSQAQAEQPDSADIVNPSVASEALASKEAVGELPSETPKEPVVDEPLNFQAFSDDLLDADDAIEFLKEFIEATRKKEARAQETQDEEIPDPMPDSLSLYLVKELEETGMLDPEIEFNDVPLVRPFRSKTFCFALYGFNLKWGELRCLYNIEAALNRVLFAWEHFVKDQQLHEKHLQGPSMEDCYRFNQDVAASITAQLGKDRIKHASMSDVLGEWGVRQALAAGIESFRLPTRLSTKFRLNLMGGDVAIVAELPPLLAQPKSVYSRELDRVIPTTKQMRNKMATDYALRCALLLASHAFRCSKRLCHVFIALEFDGPKHHACVLSGDIAREALREFDLSGCFDPIEVCHSLGLNFKLDDNDTLQGVKQGFSLDSERFCPRTRYESVDLSERILPRFEAELLGAKKVSDLAINENARRAEVAQDIQRFFTGSLARDVHSILEYTQNDKDQTVQEAGKRLVEKLIDGSLAEDDTLAITDEFVFGDELNCACEHAIELINEGKPDEAAEVLCDVLAPLDALDVYSDTDAVAWRNFSSFVGRAIYNRLHPDETRDVRLVPDAYYSAQLLQSSAQLELGNAELARSFAERAHDLNPFDMSPLLRILRCLEVEDDYAAAAEEIKKQLSTSFDLASIGTCYYRLAYFEWQLGNLEVADACYQRAFFTRTIPPFPAMIEIHMLRSANEGKQVDPDEVDNILEEAGIPLAPTEEITELLVQAAQGATDAEVFPVARSFASLLSALSGDDVMHSIARSIELDPDR